MLRVQITPNLVEMVFRAGFKTGGILEVMEGLPYNAQLADAKIEDGKLTLYFSQSTVPNETIEELRIGMKMHAAIEVEKLQAQKLVPEALVTKVVG